MKNIHRRFVLCSNGPIYTMEISQNFVAFSEYMNLKHGNKEIQKDNATPKMYGMCTILLVLCLPAALAFKYPKDSDGFWRRIFHTKSFYVLAIIAF